MWRNRGCGVSPLAVVWLIFAAIDPCSAEAQSTRGLRGDPVAIADARGMVDAMGGLEIWRELQSVHFVHEWDIFNRPDVYLEDENLDLTSPRSYGAMKSEIYDRVRADSPEHGYWNIVNAEHRGRS